jgi:flagellar basal body-associated protein FliL
MSSWIQEYFEEEDTEEKTTKKKMNPVALVILIIFGVISICGLLWVIVSMMGQQNSYGYSRYGGKRLRR